MTHALTVSDPEPDAEGRRPAALAGPARSTKSAMDARVFPPRRDGRGHRYLDFRRAADLLKGPRDLAPANRARS